MQNYKTQQICKGTEPVFFLSIDIHIRHTSTLDIRIIQSRITASGPHWKKHACSGQWRQNTDNYNTALSTLANVRLHNLHHCSIPDTHKVGFLQKLIIQECKKQIICSRVQALTKNPRHLLLRVCRYTACKNIYLVVGFFSIHLFFSPYYSQSVTSSLWMSGWRIYTGTSAGIIDSNILVNLFYFQLWFQIFTFDPPVNFSWIFRPHTS